MSYILDALKRADAERERGAVPGLHARPLPSQGNPAAAGTPKRLWWLVAGAMTLLAVGAALWVWRTPTPEAGMAVPMPMPVTAASLPTPEPALTLTPTLTLAPTPTPMPVPVAPTPTAPTSLMPVAPATIPSVVVPVPTAPRPATPPAPTAATKAAAKPSAPAPISVPASAPQDPPVAPAAVPLLSELPEAIRRQVPPLTITGTVYSDNPTQRLLLVNNQVLPQGSQVAPEVTLEEIHQRSSVFSFRGTRFRLAH